MSTSAVLTLKVAPEAHWSGSLSHMRKAAILEPVMRACLLPLAAPGAQAPKPLWGARKLFLEHQSKTTASITLLTLQAPGGTKTIHWFYIDLSEHTCCLNTQSGSRSPLKRLSESHEEAAILEPVVRACLLPLAAPRAQAPKPFWGARKLFLEHQSKTTASNHTADSTSSRWHEKDALVLYRS